jgi:hypothetical protein
MLEPGLGGQRAEPLEIGGSHARLGLQLDRRVVAQDEVDFEAACRAQVRAISER